MSESISDGRTKAARAAKATRKLITDGPKVELPRERPEFNVDVMWIKTELYKRGLKSTDLARILGVTLGNVTHLYSGVKKATVKELFALAMLFEVTPYEIAYRLGISTVPIPRIRPTVGLADEQIIDNNSYLLPITAICRAKTGLVEFITSTKMVENPTRVSGVFAMEIEKGHPTFSEGATAFLYKSFDQRDLSRVRTQLQFAVVSFQGNTSSTPEAVFGAVRRPRVEDGGTESSNDVNMLIENPCNVDAEKASSRPVLRVYPAAWIIA